MNPKEKKFNSIGNIPVHYDRYNNPDQGYGSKGKQINFYCTNDFYDKLEECFKELWSVCGLGEGSIILTAGAFVNKPKMHGKGRAIDIDGIWWGNDLFLTLNYPSEKVFYLGVESVIRQFFGTVLNYNYNIDHRDHLHIDDGTGVKFVPESESRVWYLQSCLSYIHGNVVSEDGVWGPETRNATQKTIKGLGLKGGIRNNWIEFLKISADLAFAQQ